MENGENIKVINADYKTMAKNKNTIVLDRDETGDVNITAFPELLNDITELLNYMATDEMVKLEKENREEFCKHLRETFINFEYKGNRSVFNILIDDRNRDKNFDQLLSMIATLQLVKVGKRDVKEEHEKFKDSNDNRYVYPLYGGKEEFEKKMKEQNKKKLNEKIKNMRG